MVLAGLFALGSLGFWILCSVVCICIIAAVEYEKPGWATASLIATFALIGFFGDFNVLTFARENPLSALACVGVYMVAGTLWAFSKWWFFLRARREQYDDVKREFLRRNKVEGTAIPDDLLEEWKKHAPDPDGNRYGYDYKEKTGFAPRARNHKSRILTWMIYWPWSMSGRSSTTRSSGCSRQSITRSRQRCRRCPTGFSPESRMTSVRLPHLLPLHRMSQILAMVH